MRLISSKNDYILSQVDFLGVLIQQNVYRFYDIKHWALTWQDIESPRRQASRHTCEKLFRLC